MALMDFLYLDRDLVRTFLAQLEGGQVDETTERQSASGTKGFGGTAGTAIAGLHLDRSKENSLETEAVVRQVAASEFNRLFEHISAEELVTFDEVSDPDVLGQIRRRQFIEVDGRLAISGTQQLLNLISSLGSLLPVMRQLGQDLDLDDDAAQAMKAMGALTASDAPIPAIFTVAGDVGLQVALELDQRHLVKEAIEDEATMVVRVQRVLKPDERYMVGDPFGGLTKLMPEEQRQSMLDSLKTDALSEAGVGDAEITSPGFLGTPLAIYR